jgi:hypothetical protein
MEAVDFKNGLKEIKESLKGLTLQLVHETGFKPFFNLREFGNAILAEEAKGNDFRVNRVTTQNGYEGVKSFSHLLDLLQSNTVTSVQFESFYNIKTTSEFIRSFGSLD